MVRGEGASHSRFPSIAGRTHVICCGRLSQRARTLPSGPKFDPITVTVAPGVGTSAGVTLTMEGPAYEVVEADGALVCPAMRTIHRSAVPTPGGIWQAMRL